MNEPRTEAGRVLLAAVRAWPSDRFPSVDRAKLEVILRTDIPRIEAEARVQGALHERLISEGEEAARTADRPSLREAIEALTSEDEIAHGEAWDDIRKMGLGFCAYCDADWPCRTQRGIDRLLAALRQALEGEEADLRSGRSTEDEA